MTMERKLQSLVCTSYYSLQSLGSVCATAQGPKGLTSLQLWIPERRPQEGAGTGKGSQPVQRNGETVLQRETGRVGSPQPNQSKSEGSSDWKTDHKIDSRNRKRPFPSMTLLTEEQEPANK